MTMSDENLVRHDCGGWIMRGEVCRTCELAYGLCPVCGKNVRGNTMYCSDNCKKVRAAKGVELPKETRYLYAPEFSEWANDAVCAQVDPELFFPVSSDAAELRRMIASARKICTTCPVRQPCLREGMQNTHGIWAGWTADERRTLQDRIAKMPKNVQREVIDAAATRGPASLGID